MSMEGKVVAVTGGASGIGAETVRVFAAAGAKPAVLDLDKDAADALAAETGGIGLLTNVCDNDSVIAAFAAIKQKFGRVDVVISNAGISAPGYMLEISDELFHRSFEVNFFSHHLVSRAAVKLMREGDGGCILYNASMVAVNPGPNLGGYGAPKAAVLYLMRQYAVEHGKDGIRCNALNAARVRSGITTDKFIAERAEARGVSKEEYMRGNLLQHEVTANDVANGFLLLAQAEATTGTILTVDGGIGAGFPR